MSKHGENVSMWPALAMTTNITRHPLDSRTNSFTNVCIGKEVVVEAATGLFTRYVEPSSSVQQVEKEIRIHDSFQMKNIMFSRAPCRR